MTPAERAVWERAMRRAAAAQPAVAAALLNAFALLSSDITIAAAAKAIESGDVEELLRILFTQALFDRAMQPTRERLRRVVADSARYYVREVQRTVPPSARLTLQFNLLNPNVVRAITTLETRVITTLGDNIRETVRDAVRVGLEQGKGPRAIALGLRDLIGLAPNQLAAVQHFEEALRSGSSSALGYQLRDRRFDGIVRRGEATEAQITRMVASYRKRMIAFNAETNARTATLDALKLGQHLSWQDAIDKGFIDGALLTKRWGGVLDARERPEHVAMEGETVGFDAEFSNGQTIPGDTDFNCRCLARYTLPAAT